MKLRYCIILLAAVVLMLNSCGEIVNPVGTEADLYGKWQNTTDTGWYRVFTNETVEDGASKWGKEWYESEGVYESDLVLHGNGWFQWMKTDANMLEIEMMEYGWSDIPFQYTFTILNNKEMSYKTESGKTYTFKKVQ